MSGRRPGPSTTRQRLIDAARDAFAESGIDGATTREIAKRAGVDPAMIAHYFGSKGGLVKAVTALPFDPADVVAPALEAAPEDAARVLIEVVLPVWDDHSRVLVGVLRSATRNSMLAAQMRSFILDRALRPVVSRFSPDPDEVDKRAALLASQVVGLLLARYVMKWEPLASAEAGWIARHVGPTMQRYLTDPLPD